MRAQNSPPRTLLARLRGRLAAEQGVTLILALGFVTIFSISTAAIVNELVLNESGARRDEAMITALGAAEAQLNFAQQWVQQNDADASLPTGKIYPVAADTPNAALASGDEPPYTTLYYTGNPIDGATDVGWWAHKYDGATCDTFNDNAQNLPCWVVNGRATVGLSTREVQVILNGATFQTTTDTVTTTDPTQEVHPGLGTTTNTSTTTVPVVSADYGSWGYGAFSSAAVSNCLTMSGQASIKMPVYTPGNLCMSGQAEIVQNPPANDVFIFVKGTLSGSGQSHVGTSSSKVVKATVGSCLWSNSAVICSSSGSSKIYANTYASSGGAIAKPSVNAASVYLSADPGPNHPCTVAAGSTASSTWPTFDTNGVRDNSVGNTTSPFTGTSYVCKTASGGSISWNATTKVFTATGTIFIDGNLVLTGNSTVYDGRGNIYYNGTADWSGQATICANSGCTTNNWNMAVDLLLIAALNNGVVPASCGDTWKMAGQAKFQGAAYVNGCISESGQGGVEGPAIADGYSISGQGSYYQALGTNSLPPGAPVNSVTTSTSVQTTATVTYTTATTIFGSTTVETPISRPMWGQLATSWRQLK